MKRLIGAALVAVFGLLLVGGTTPAHASRKLVIVGYAVPGEALQQGLAPAFARKWAAEHNGEQITFEYSFGGSSIQSRNVAAGLEADVVYLSDWPDVQRLADAGLVRPNWNDGERGIVSRSLVVFRVPAGNPLHIRDWSDLLKPGVRVLTPNPKTSGAARWNILALYGSVLKNGGTPAQAEAALRTLYRNVVTFGESGRATTQDFERGVGDVAITYENEILLRRRQGKDVSSVVPVSTIYIENPAAVVKAYAEKHGVLNVADAFVTYLRTAEAQRILAEFGFRSIEEGVTRQYASRYPVPAKVFDVAFLGGYANVLRTIFDRGALWDRIIRTERRNRR